jgi:phosphoesterase RecJ-like protein
MNTTPLAEIAGLLLRAERVLALCHVSPDGDAIGSLLALGSLLRQSADGRSAPNREITLVSADGVPEQFRFLPGASHIRTAAPSGPWDVVVTLDASDIRRLGEPFHPETYGGTPLVNIDHHVTNLYFGTHNYVDPSAAATAQIVVHLADAMSVPISHETAICLLTGLATDTLGFRTSNVTPDVLRTGIRLMEAGADLSDIIARTLTYRPVDVMRLWGLALGELRSEGRAIWAVVSDEMRERVGAPQDAESGLVSFLIGAPEADIAAVFSEAADHRVEVSFRARPGFDVSALALSLGGGGHPQASGCALPGSLADVETRVAPMLIALAAEQGPAAGE